MPRTSTSPRLASAPAVKSCSPADEPAITHTTSASRAASAMRERTASRLSPTGARRHGSPPHSRTKAAIMRELNSTMRPGRRGAPGSISSSPVGRIATTGRGRTATSTIPAASSAPTSYGRISCPRASSSSPATTSSPTRRTCCHGDAGARTCTTPADAPAGARGAASAAFAASSGAQQSSASAPDSTPATAGDDGGAGWPGPSYTRSIITTASAHAGSALPVSTRLNGRAVVAGVPCSSTTGLASLAPALSAARSAMPSIAAPW